MTLRENMKTDKSILVVGTFDTKNDELSYLADCIKSQGGNVVTMDVSVLGNSKTKCNYSKHDVASAADCKIEDVIEIVNKWEEAQMDDLD